MRKASRAGRSSGRTPIDHFPDDERHRAPALPRSWSVGRSRDFPAYSSQPAPAAPVVGAIRLITDRAAWADAIEDRCARFDLVIERWSWHARPPTPPPYRVFLLDIARRSPAVSRVVSRLAEFAWQPLCIVSVAPVPGAVSLVSRLDDMAFDHVLSIRDRPSYWDAVRDDVDAVLRGDGWLLPLAAQALSCHEPAVLRALMRLLEPMPGARTVTRWANTLQLRRQDLGTLFAVHGLPSPKAVLDLVRLARVTYASSERPQLSRDELARRFGYSSGDYLGKRAKQLTGCAFGQVVAAGPALPISMLTRRSEVAPMCRSWARNRRCPETFKDRS